MPPDMYAEFVAARMLAVGSCDDVERRKKFPAPPMPVVMYERVEVDDVVEQTDENILAVVMLLLLLIMLWSELDEVVGEP